MRLWREVVDPTLCPLFFFLPPAPQLACTHKFTHTRSHTRTHTPPRPPQQLEIIMTDPAEELVDYEEEELVEPKAGAPGGADAGAAAGAKKAGFVGIHRCVRVVCEVTVLASRVDGVERSGSRPGRSHQLCFFSSRISPSPARLSLSHRSSGFKDFLLKPELLRAIVDCGFEHPSEGKAWGVGDEGAAMETGAATKKEDSDGVSAGWRVRQGACTHAPHRARWKGRHLGETSRCREWHRSRRDDVFAPSHDEHSLPPPPPHPLFFFFGSANLPSPPFARPSHIKPDHSHFPPPPPPPPLPSLSLPPRMHSPTRVHPPGHPGHGRALPGQVGYGQDGRLCPVRPAAAGARRRRGRRHHRLPHPGAGVPGEEGMERGGCARESGGVNKKSRV